MTYSCDLCDNSFSTPFNLRRHMERKHGVEVGSVSARHPKRSRVDDGVYDDIEQRGMVGGGYGDDVDDGVRKGGSLNDGDDIFDGSDVSEVEDKSDTDDESNTDDETDADEDDPLDYKDPDNWYETRDKDAAFNFILSFLPEHLKKIDESSLPEAQKTFREHYETFVLFCRNLRRNKTHKKIMTTVKELMNRNESEKFSFKEALKEGIRQRKFLLDSMMKEVAVDDEEATDEDAESTEEEEEMDNVY